MVKDCLVFSYLFNMGIFIFLFGDSVIKNKIFLVVI